MHLLTCVCLAAALAIGAGQSAQKAADPWSAFQFLLGTWSGEGQGQPGATTGTATFKLDLDGRIMVRTSSTSVAARDKQPAYVHRDLLIIYHETAGQPAKALYFDNEDHAIEYDATVAADGSAITFVSKAAPSAPHFRLVYTRLGADSVEVRFEMAPPGSPDAFQVYTKGVTHRVH